MAPLLGWSADQEREEIERFTKDAEKIFRVG
jgi:hypothetical protein